MTQRSETPHQALGSWRGFVTREWLALASLAVLVAVSAAVGRLPRVSAGELQVLYILAVLLIAARTLELGGLFTRLSARLERDRRTAFKLVIGTFFLAMLATNDAALIVAVPLTLVLGGTGVDWLVILEALAANAGSALTPFGNPQNLFIYWYYGISPADFLVTMAPFSGMLLVLLLAATAVAGRRCQLSPRPAPPAPSGAGYVGLGLLAVAILIILHVLPLAAGLVIPGYAAAFNRPSLRIDFGLLATFLCFFAIAEDLKLILSPAPIRHADAFIASAVASQFMSNVPAALVIAKFTSHWKALLWGTNAGGFGSLIGSLANLIAYRLYIAKADRRAAVSFTAKFLAANIAALLISAALYYIAGPTT